MSRSRWLRIALAVAPFTAFIYTAASWTRFYLTGNLELRPSVPLTWCSGSGSLALAILGSCCVIAYLTVEQGDIKRILKCSLLVHGCLLLAIPLQDSDFFVYLSHGTLVAHGLNPHVVGSAVLGNSPIVALSPWRNTPSPYGPVATLITAAGGFVGEKTHSPVWVNGAAYKIIAGLLDIWGLLLAAAVTRRADMGTSTQGFAAFALNPLLAWAVAAQGHNEGLLVLFSLIFLWAMQRQYDVVATVALTLGTMTKFVFGPLVAVYLLVTGRASMKRALLLGALCAALSVILFWPWWPGLQTLLSFSQPKGLPADTIHSAASMHWVIFRLQSHLGMSEKTMQTTYHLFSGVGKICAGMLFLVLAPRASIKTLPHVFVIVLLSLIATSVWLMNWYFLWPLPFAIVETDRRWQRMVLATTVLAVLASGPGKSVLIQPPVQFAVVVAILAWRAWNIDQAGQLAPQRRQPSNQLQIG